MEGGPRGGLDWPRRASPRLATASLRSAAADLRFDTGGQAMATFVRPRFATANLRLGAKRGEWRENGESAVRVATAVAVPRSADRGEA